MSFPHCKVSQATIPKLSISCRQAVDPRVHSKTWWTWSCQFMSLHCLAHSSLKTIIDHSELHMLLDVLWIILKNISISNIYKHIYIYRYCVSVKLNVKVVDKFLTMWRETRNSMDHLFEEISARVNDLLLDQGLWVTMVTISYNFRLHWLDSDRIFMGFIMMLWNLSWSYCLHLCSSLFIWFISISEARLQQ